MEHKFKELFFKEDYFSDFYFFNIGYEQCQSGHRFGPSLRENHLLHFIVSGKGRYTVAQQTYHLASGDFFLIRPNELIDYQADETEPWAYYWLGFSGEQVDKILQANGLAAQDYVGQVTQQAELQRQFAGLMQLDFFDAAQKLTNQAKFYTAFAFFQLQKTLHSAGAFSKRKKYSESFVLYVENNYYREDLTIEEIAKSLYLHPAYFSQVIKEELGLTALAYVTLYRMNKASVLLTATGLAVEEIASAVGYQNRHSFSRAFKKRFLVTPSMYREQK